MSGLKIIFLVLWMILVPVRLSGSSKIDTIYFQNGDRVTAEVKSLANNHLRLSTDDAGTVMVEWNKVDSVKILNPMRIVLDGGEILYGRLLTSGVVQSCIIWHRDGDPRLTALVNIVSLSPVEEKVLDRLAGTLSSGFSYTKASEVMTINLNGSVKYIAEKNHLEAFYDGNLTNDSKADINTQRQSGGANFRRILPGNWFLASGLSAESNSEQGLDLRTSLGLGGGKSIIHTNTSHFYTIAGVLGNREESAESSQFNIEGMISVKYSLFIYDSPEVSFDVSGDLIPSLNDLGRIRAELGSNLKWEVFSDFYLKWTFWYSFDSRPLSSGGDKSDWAVNLLGLEYTL